jgi:hypothetical protein
MPRDPQTGKTTVPPGRYLARAILKSKALTSEAIELIKKGQREGWTHNQIRDEIADTVVNLAAIRMRETWREEAEAKGVSMPTRPPFLREDMKKAAARIMRATPIILKCG